MAFLMVTLSLVVIFITALLLYFRKVQFYWESRGIPHEPAAFIVGNMKGVGTETTIMEPFNRAYNKFKNTSPVAGMVFFFDGIYITTSLEFVKSILIKDFQNFNDRNMYVNEENDPLSAHMFSLKGKQWKDLRTKVSPTFTSGKMKFMFPTIVEVSKEMGAVFAEKSSQNFVLEIRDAMSRFTVDVIGKCAFGLDTNTMRNPDDEFIKMGKKAFGEQRHSDFITNMIQSFQTAAKLFGMKIIRDDVTDFFLGIVKKTVEYREENKIQKNDFMNLLIELKNGAEENRLTLNEISAQAFLFFVAGFETTSATLGFLFYHLALDQEMQDKARAEVNEVLKKCNGKLEYENIKDLVYLDMLFNETLRMYPPVPIYMRKAINDFKIPDTDITLEAGKGVMIPVYAIQHDPEIFPEPEKFIPERFTPEEVANRHPMAFIPFGEGPRICIGLRFAKMQAYVGLVELLSKFKFLPTENTPKKIEFVKNKFFLTAEGEGIPLRIEQI
ncbi:hypothetical protein ACFFRR_006159 [Megaselia abdita]